MQRRGRHIENDFTPLGEPLSIVFPQVVSLLRLLETRPPLNPIPRWYDMSTYCNYHRATGHLTDDCHTLRDVIQNLIDNGVLIASPQGAAHTPAPAHPSIASLSLPEPVGSEDPRTLGVYLLAPVLADSSPSLVDPLDHIDITSSPFLS